MDSRPSTFKAVQLSDKNFDQQLLQWFDECGNDSDVQDKCTEETHIESGHNTDSEEEADDEANVENADDRLECEENANLKYYYGKNRFKWSSEPTVSNRGRRLQENIISHLPGLRPPDKALGKKPGALQIWELLFTEEMCNIILQWTNHKIEVERSRYRTENASTLKNVDKTELYAFFGLLTYTAVFKLHNECINILFATDGTGREIIRCIMSKERFAFLLTCLRFDNPDDRIMRNMGNPAAAMSQIFKLFVQNCQDCYTIGESTCVDEMLVGFRGRCKFKMYIPNKPAKYGLKIMCCTDAQTGYFYNGYIYTDKDSDARNLPNEYKKFSKPAQSVLRLTQPIYNSNRSVTFDNWVTSIELVNILKQRGLTCIGTIRKNKKEIPSQFLPNRRRMVGSALYGFTRDITLVSYVPKINEAVILVSSSHHHKSEDQESGKPYIILDYNSTKGGVDAIDEKCSQFSCSRRSRRWPLTIFYRLFDISTVNSFTLYNSYSENIEMDRSDFMKKLALELVTPHLQRRSKNLKVSRKLRLSIFEVLGEKIDENLPETRVETSVPIERNEERHMFLTTARFRFA